MGWVTAVFITVAAVAAIVWGYQSDRQLKRKPFLLVGTAVWCVAMILTGLSQSFPLFFLFQLITAVGVGAVGSLGFSVVSDIVPADRRGLALSLWSISQGLGATFGALLASTVGAFNWQAPFFILAAIGLTVGFIYIFVPEPKRGAAEPELRPLFATGQTYNTLITRDGLRQIWQQQTTRWLLIQSFFFSFAYGVFVWVPRWAIAKVQVQGLDLESATVIGNGLVVLFSVGSVSSVFMGHWGDRLEKEDVRKRPLLAMYGLGLSAPFFITLFFLPLSGIAEIPDSNLAALISWTARSVVSSPFLIAAFVLATVANIFQATDPPNWAAMITTLNLPEHRATTIGLSRLIRAVANALSIGLGGLLFEWLRQSYSETTSYALGLALFQSLIVIAAACYWFVAKYIRQDVVEVRGALVETAVAKKVFSKQ